MNASIKPYFDQLIEDRNFTHSTGPRPLGKIQAYIESLEEYIEVLEGVVELSCGNLAVDKIRKERGVRTWLTKSF